MDVSCESWHFLEPWCAHLRGRVTIDARVRHSVSSRTRRSGAWLCVALPPDGKDANWPLIAHLREALELLAAVAWYADAASVRWLLTQRCGVVGIDDASDALLATPRFSLAFRQYATLDISWGATLFHQFFLALDHTTLSRAFRAALAHIQQIRGDVSEHPQPQPRIAVEIAFSPPELPPHWSLPFLTSVREVVQAIQDEAESADAFPFALESVRLNANHVKLAKKTLAVLTDLFALGATVPLLSLHGSTAIAKAPRHYMGQFVTAMTRGGDASPRDADRTLRLRGPGVDAHQFGAFCSALATTRRLDSVQLSDMFAEARGYQRYIKWQWVAYAFFTRVNFRSAVTSVHIDDTSLRDDDVAAVASIVDATYPAKVLLRVDTSDLERREETQDSLSPPPDTTSGGVDVVSVLLSKGTRVHIDPYDPFDRRSFELSADDHFLVMRDVPSSDFVEILVPGYAHCAVSRDLVQYFLGSSEDENETSALPTRSRVIALHLEFKRAVPAATLEAFLLLVGAPLETLVLKARALSSDTLVALLCACPRLKRLSIDLVTASALDVLVHAYAMSACAITSLSLQGLELESEEVSHFARTLGSNASAIAQTLDELVIGERVESFALDESNLVALLAMLETNRKLAYVELYVESALYDNFLPLFSEFHGQALPVLREHMPLACRLAFLSVVFDGVRSSREDGDADGCRARKRARRYSSGSSSSSSSTTTADTSRLDRHVLSLIFHFAALRTQRIVKLVRF